MLGIAWPLHNMARMFANKKAVHRMWQRKKKIVFTNLYEFRTNLNCSCLFICCCCCILQNNLIGWSFREKKIIFRRRIFKMEMKINSGYWLTFLYLHRFYIGSHSNAWLQSMKCNMYPWKLQQRSRFKKDLNLQT